MKTNFIRAGLACLALTLTAPAAMAAQADYFLKIDDVKITVRKAGETPLEAITDRKGQATVQGLAPGEYKIVIDGKTLVAAMDRLVPPPRKSEGGSSVSIGGAFGGGGHSSDHEGHGDGSRSGGGVGLGLGIHNSGGNPDTNPMAPGIMVDIKLGALGHVSSVSPYCRESADQGLVLIVTVPDQGGEHSDKLTSTGVINSLDLTMSIFDRWGEM